MARTRSIRRRALLGGALAAGALAAGCAARKDAMPLLRPSGKFVDAEGARIHYRILGDKGPPVIALHGASGNLLDWVAGVGPRIARNHRLLLLDRPGLGYSTKPDPSASDIFVQSRILHSAAQQLGFGRATLIGHSFGGSIALAWASTIPTSVSGLMILSAPSQVWPGGLGILNDLLQNPVTGPVLVNVGPRIAGGAFIKGITKRVFAPQPVPEGYTEAVNAEIGLQPRLIRNNNAELARLKESVRVMVPHYPRLPMRVEILHGTVDAIVPIDIHADITAKQITNVGYTRLDGIGHMPHHVAPDALMAALDRLS